MLCMYVSLYVYMYLFIYLLLLTRVQRATTNKRVILPHPPPHCEVIVVPDESVHGQ